MKALKKGILKRVSNDDVHSHQPAAPSVNGGDVFYDAPEAMLHEDAHEEGGMGFTNRELLASQRGAIIDIAKDLGRKLLTGSLNLINLSMPVRMFEDRSYLQKLADVWVYPRLLSKAVEAKDPVVRLQWTVAWFVAGLQHVFQSWKKPFNPLLGETWQAQQAGGGCQIFMEQLSHHPPISAFEMIGPGGAYTFTGHSQPDVSFKANTIKTTAKGYRCLTFADDGTKIDIVYPSYHMHGILYSDMPRGDMGGDVLFTDRTHKLCCQMQFGKVDGGQSPLLQRPDTISGTIFRLPAGFRDGDPLPSSVQQAASKLSVAKLSGGLFRGNSSGADDMAAAPAAVSSCVGNWLSHLDWDGSRMWTLAEEQPETWQPVANPLPSDCRFRLDLATLADGDPTGAQSAKEALENRQRQDAKLRKEAGVSS